MGHLEAPFVLCLNELPLQRGSQWQLVIVCQSQAFQAIFISNSEAFAVQLYELNEALVYDISSWYDDEKPEW